MIKLFLICLVLISLVFVAMAIKLILDKNAKFTAGSCSGSSALNKRGIDCSCGGKKCENA